MSEELIKRLKDKATRFDYDGWVDTAAIIEEAAETIEELSKPRWIPVTERLPEKDKWVLRYSTITEATWLAYLNSAGAWIDEQGEVRYVTHWMPLPEPPKEET